MNLSFDRNGSAFTMRWDIHDQVSNTYMTQYLTMNWREADELANYLSQLLLDHAIEKEGSPDFEDFLLEPF